MSEGVRMSLLHRGSLRIKGNVLMDVTAQNKTLTVMSQHTCAILRPALLRSYLYFRRLLLDIQHF